MELIRESKGTIFFGHVTSIREVLLPSGRPGQYIPMRDVTLRNIEKGSRKPRTVTVRTGAGSGDCGYDFVIGGEYMVEMNRANGRYETNVCTLTRSLADYLSQTTSTTDRGATTAPN